MGISKKKLVLDMLDIEVTQVYSVINILLKYNWYLNSIDNKAAINLRLQSIKNY